MNDRWLEKYTTKNEYLIKINKYLKFSLLKNYLLFY